MNIIFIYKDEQDLEKLPSQVLDHSCVHPMTSEMVMSESLKGLQSRFNKAFVLVFPNALPFLIMDIIAAHALETATVNTAADLDINDLLTFPLMRILDKAEEHKPE